MAKIKQNDIRKEHQQKIEFEGTYADNDINMTREYLTMLYVKSYKMNR